MRDLDRLLRVRTAWERRAAARLGEKLACQAAAEEALQAAVESHRRSLDTALSSTELTRLARTATHDDLGFRAAEHELANRAVDASRGVWRRTQQDLEILQKLSDRWTERAEQEHLRREQQEADELAALRRRPR